MTHPKTAAEKAPHVSPKTQPDQPRIQGANEHDTMLNEHIKAGVFSRKGQPALPTKRDGFITHKVVAICKRAGRPLAQHDIRRLFEEEFKRPLGASTVSEIFARIKAGKIPDMRDVDGWMVEFFTRAHLAPAPRPKEYGLTYPPLDFVPYPALPTSEPLRGAFVDLVDEMAGWVQRKSGDDNVAESFHIKLTQRIHQLFSAHPIPQAAPTAEAVKELNGIVEDYYFQSAIAGGKFNNVLKCRENAKERTTALLSRALEASAHLAAAPGVGPADRLFGLLQSLASDYRGSLPDINRPGGLDPKYAKWVNEADVRTRMQYIETVMDKGNAILAALTAPAQPDTLIREAE